MADASQIIPTSQKTSIEEGTVKIYTDHGTENEVCTECPSAALLAHTQPIEQHLVIVRNGGHIEDIRSTNPDAIDSITILDIGSVDRDQFPDVKRTVEVQGFEGYTGVATQWGRPNFTEVDKVKSLITMLTKASDQ